MSAEAVKSKAEKKEDGEWNVIAAGWAYGLVFAGEEGLMCVCVCVFVCIFVCVCLCVSRMVCAARNVDVCCRCRDGAWCMCVGRGAALDSTHPHPQMLRFIPAASGRERLLGL
jgi:hypothetical protein